MHWGTATLQVLGVPEPRAPAPTDISLAWYVGLPPQNRMIGIADGRGNSLFTLLIREDFLLGSV